MMGRTRKAVVTAAAVSAIALVGASACTNDDSDDTAATTTTQEHTDHTTEAETTTEESGVADTAVAAVQDAVNSAVEAAPVTFEADTAELTTVSGATIRAVTAALGTNDDTIEIKTYARADDADAAAQLADQRATAVVDSLVDNGIERDRITVTATANPEDQDVDVDRVEFVVGEE